MWIFRMCENCVPVYWCVAVVRFVARANRRGECADCHVEWRWRHHLKLPTDSRPSPIVWLSMPSAYSAVPILWPFYRRCPTPLCRLSWERLMWHFCKDKIAIGWVDFARECLWLGLGWYLLCVPLKYWNDWNLITKIPQSECGVTWCGDDKSLGRMGRYVCELMIVSGKCL